MICSENLILHSSPTLHRCEALWSWSPSPHGDYDLWIVLDGEGELMADQKTYDLSAGSAFLFAPDTRIRARHNPVKPLRVFSVHFDLDNPSPPLEYLFVKINNMAFYEMMIRRCVSLFARGDASGHKQSLMILQLMVMQFMELCSLPDDLPVEKEMLDLIAAINEEPGKNWTVEQMAKQTHLSRSRFFHLFVATVADSPMHYVIRARINRAGTLLKESNMRISEIAEALGYADIYYFSRQFKKETGRSPLAFRRTNRTAL
jgi:AraC family transcriptional regulator of arabinose operon